MEVISQQQDDGLRSNSDQLRDESANVQQTSGSFRDTTRNKQLYEEYFKNMLEYEGLLEGEANEFDCELEWYNSEPLYFEGNLKNKLVLIDFWTSCCCDCLHLLPVLEKLEKKFEGKHGVAFIGVHSGKFDAESDSYHLKKNIVKYSIAHPVINDASMQLWTEYECYYWPTVFIIAPNRKIIKLYKEIVPPEDLEVFLEAAYDFYYEELNQTPLPIRLEKEKAQLERNDLIKSGAFFSEEKEKAIKSNLSFPHKIKYVSQQECGLYGCDFLVISDMGNNRIILVNEQTHECLEVIGSGKCGFKDGKFKYARFNQTFGVAYHDNCLYICDGKNHRIRLADLGTKEVKTIAGTGIRGEDPTTSNPNMIEQNLTTPFDIDYDREENVFYIAMSGIHQIWKLDLTSSTIMPFSGSGVEGCHDDSELLKCTWAQPSGVTIGTGKNNEKEIYIADSESSCIRAINLSEQTHARTLVGGDGTSTNLFSYGDKDGHSTEAKLQHPVGLKYITPLNKVLVTDSYNHKIKLVDPQTDDIVAILGSGQSGLVDGQGIEAEFIEPTDLCYKVNEESGDITLYICDSSNDAIRKVVIHKDQDKLQSSKVETLCLGNVPPVVTVVKSDMVECGENGCRLIK